jgi:HTH-type transcriptional regulator / antitoxin HigA
MKTSTKVIGKDSEYKKVMKKIDVLMNKGSEHVTKSELNEIRELALMAQSYEKQNYTIKAPSTLAGVIEMKMYEMRLKQTEMAQKLQISNAKLSMIMHGKQKPDVAFLKSVHEQLYVDANLLFDVI